MRKCIPALIAALALGACEKEAPQKSLVGDFPVPGIHALAGDTITVWQRVRRPDGQWRFHSYSINTVGTVEFLDEHERIGAQESTQEAPGGPEQRQAFALPQAEFEALRAQAALLRPASLGPDQPVGGYGGEVLPAGCELDETKPRIAGVNFLNGGNWGNFVLQPGCDSDGAKEAAALMTQILDRLKRAADAPSKQRSDSG
jgi:hypothetical protein